MARRWSWVFGQFLLAANGTGRNLTTFRVDATTGALTSLGTQAVNTLGTTGDITGLAFAPQPTILVSTGTGPTGGPHVKLFLVDSAGAPTQLAPGFMAYDPGFTGGVQATLVSVGSDLFLVTGVGSGGGRTSSCSR